MSLKRDRVQLRRVARERGEAEILRHSGGGLRGEGSKGLVRCLVAIGGTVTAS